MRILSTFACAVLLAACDVSVKNGEGDKTNQVDIRTPVGDLSVRTDASASDTGLPVYPGARPVRDDDDSGSADINIGTSLVGLRIVATKFESADTPAAVINFYKDKMKTYGEVKECSGDFDFEGEQAICKDKAGSGEIQLVAGTENQHRIVSVKERGSGSEFAVVYIHIREEV
jgi:hypothetical protein